MYRIYLLSWGPFFSHVLVLILAWMNDRIHYKVWDEIISQFPNFNSATVEVWEMDKSFHSIFHWACDYLLRFFSMLVKWATAVFISLLTLHMWLSGVSEWLFIYRIAVVPCDLFEILLMQGLGETYFYIIVCLISFISISLCRWCLCTCTIIFVFMRVPMNLLSIATGNMWW